RALDKFFVNFHSACGSIQREKTQKKRDRQDRQSIHAANKNILRGRIGRHCETKQVWRDHPNKEHEKQKSKNAERNRTVDRSSVRWVFRDRCLFGQLGCRLWY